MAEIEVKDADLKPSGTRETLDVVIRGGPLTHGKDFEFTVDGERPKHVTSVELFAGVNDVMRIRTEQILVHGDVTARVAQWEKVVLADVRLHSDEEGVESVKVTGRGKTALEALKNAVAHLEKEQA